MLSVLDTCMRPVLVADVDLLRACVGSALDGLGGSGSV